MKKTYIRPELSVFSFSNSIAASASDVTQQNMSAENKFLERIKDENVTKIFRVTW